MSSMSTSNGVYRNSNGSQDGGSSRGGSSGGGCSSSLVVTPNTNTKVTAAASAAVSAGTSLGLFADVHSLVDKVHQLLLEDEGEEAEGEEFEVEGDGSTDRRHQIDDHGYDDDHHHQHHQRQQQQQRRFDHRHRRIRREKAVREKELRQCLRKLHTIFQSEELHKVLQVEDGRGSGVGGGNVRGMDFHDDNDHEEEGGGGGGGGGDDDNDDEQQQHHKEEVLHQPQRHRRQQQEHHHHQQHQHQQHSPHLSPDRRHELITGFTEDLVELMTTLTTLTASTTSTTTTSSATSIINDPSVVQLWKTLVPYSAILIPTSYLTEDQIWKLFVCVLQQLHDLDQMITNYNNHDSMLYSIDDDDDHRQQQYAYGYGYGFGGEQSQSQQQQRQKSHYHHDDDRDGGRMMDFSHVAVTDVMDGTGTTSSAATASHHRHHHHHHSHRQWPPSEIDREAFQGLLGQLLGALELNPTYFDGVLPPDEADEVLMRPIKFLCRVTRLEEQQQQQQQQQHHRSQQQQQQHYGGLPLDLVFSLRVLVDHLLTNLKRTVVAQQKQHNDDDEEDPSTTLTFREWLQRKKKNNQIINEPPLSSPFTNNQNDDNNDDDDDNDQDDSDVHDINITFNFLDEYAMDLADQAIHYLHDVETKTFMTINDVGRDDEQQEKKTSSPHHENSEEVITALQYANLASNFFFHTEQDGFYHSPQLQGLSRSLWHAVGEFALLVMESDGGGGGLGRKGPINNRPVLSLEWDATLTESLFRLTKTQIVCSPGPLVGPTSPPTDGLHDKELDYVVTTILRLLDNSARSLFSNDEWVVSWVDELLKYSSFGRDKLLPPLRAALLSTICISGNYKTEMQDRLVSSLLKLTGLSKDDDGDGDGTPQQPQVVRGQPETVNDVWTDFMLDQIYGKSFNNRMY